MMKAMLMSLGLSDNMWGKMFYLLVMFSIEYLIKIRPDPMWTMERLRPNLSFLRVWGCLTRVPLLDLKWENISPKTFDYVFIGYAQNSAAYRFMSLNDFSICKSRDAKFFDHVFPLKKNVSTTVHETVPVYDDENMLASSSIIRESIDEPRRSDKRRVETSLLPTFLQPFWFKTLMWIY